MEANTEVLTALTHKVRVMSVEQIGREFFHGAADANRSAKRLVTTLTQEQLLESQTVVVHPLISLEQGPIFSWRPGNHPPNFPRLAWQVRARWKLSPKSMLVVRASQHARQLLRGTVGGRRARGTEMRHDLMVTELWFKLTREFPHCDWIHEDTLISNGQHIFGMTIPDALVNGEPHDFAGSYKAEKLRSLHRSLMTAPYTIW